MQIFPEIKALGILNKTPQDIVGWYADKALAFVESAMGTSEEVVAHPAAPVARERPAIEPEKELALHLTTPHTVVLMDILQEETRIEKSIEKPQAKSEKSHSGKSQGSHHHTHHHRSHRKNK